MMYPIVVLLAGVPLQKTMWSRQLDDIYLHPSLDLTLITVRVADKGEERWAA
jgi:hypothetical protein